MSLLPLIIIILPILLIVSSIRYIRRKSAQTPSNYKTQAIWSFALALYFLILGFLQRKETDFFVTSIFLALLSCWRGITLVMAQNKVRTNKK
jgi:hypothetical protein